MFSTEALIANLAGWRMVCWVSLVMFGALSLQYLWQTRGAPMRSDFRVFMAGGALASISLGLQQFVWWRNEVYIALGHCYSHDIDYDVVLCGAQKEWAAFARVATPVLYAGFAVGHLLGMPSLITMWSGLAIRTTRLITLTAFGAIYVIGRNPVWFGLVL